ncbi:gliotoxin biosynthesis N-methyltransferase [Microdochium nivale]|nr:gliotoxin biosynthesis N-methyltransferase [Microdochium nivale]
MADQQPAPQPASPPARQPTQEPEQQPRQQPRQQPEQPALEPAQQPDVQSADPIAANPDAQPDFDDDADSALGNDVASSTDSVASSILKYRTIQGRTFHSERQNVEYFTPNDDQQQTSVDITHHYLTILLDGKLHLVPKQDFKKVLDVGTGTGIWAIDFADVYPDADIIGTDLSPIQPSWVPPNVRFEIDDFLDAWTWDSGTFDFVHMRFLFGAVPNWNDLFAKAYGVLAPGGYVQTCECDVEILSDDGTVPKDSVMTTQWTKMFRAAGKVIGNSFTVIEQDLQRKGMEAAGFEELKEYNFKVPVGGWAKDPRLSEVGKFVLLTLLNDIEGYTMFIWKQIFGDDVEAYQLFLAQLRKEIKSPAIHSYMKVRYIVGRKPGQAAA